MTTRPAIDTYIVIMDDSVRIEACPCCGKTPRVTQEGKGEDRSYIHIKCSCPHSPTVGEFYARDSDIIGTHRRFLQTLNSVAQTWNKRI